MENGLFSRRNIFSKLYESLKYYISYLLNLQCFDEVFRKKITLEEKVVYFSGQASKVYEKLSSMFYTFGEAKYHSQEHMVVHK